MTTWSRRLVLSAAVMGLMLSGCTPQELAEIFAVRDLTESDDPVEVAAGDAAVALDSDRAAQKLADEGLREKSEDKLMQAAEERPRDARYPAYLAAHYLANGDTERYWASIRQTAAIVAWEHRATVKSLGLQEGSEEEQRIYYRANIHYVRSIIEGIDWALAIERGREPVDSDRVDNLETKLCDLHAQFLEQYAFAPGGPPILVLVGGAECTTGP